MFNHCKKGRIKYLLDRDKDLERLLFFSLDRDLYLRLSLERDLSGKQKLNSKTRNFLVCFQQIQQMFIPGATAAKAPPPRRSVVQVKFREIR